MAIHISIFQSFLKLASLRSLVPILGTFGDNTGRTSMAERPRNDDCCGNLRKHPSSSGSGPPYAVASLPSQGIVGRTCVGSRVLADHS
jgi:hypothetical protein